MNVLRTTMVFLLFTGLIGCQQANEAGKEPANDDRGLMEIDNNDYRQTRQQEMPGNEVAKRLVTLSTSVPQVKDAAALVLGEYAMVGIDVDKNLDRSRVSTIKYSVAQALKKDPYGKNAVITADVDTVERLKEMGQQIQNGAPVRGIMNELAAIIGRLMPQTPGNVETQKQPQQPVPDKNNKRTMPENEQRDLEKQQQKQGKIQQRPTTNNE